MSEEQTPSGDIWYKSKRALRTAFTTILTILPLVPQVIAIVQDQWDIEWLTAVGVQTVALNAALSRIIAIPVIDRWLTQIGLGSAPKQKVKKYGLDTSTQSVRDWTRPQS